MKVLLSWLKEFVDITLPPVELAQLLTMSGTEVGYVEEVGSRWANIWIGQVRGLRPHPSAERLFVVDVDLGSRSITLVTAATNLTVGDKIPVILAGGRLQPGITIEAVDFRGIRSEGMLCSGIELGVSPDGEGIYVMEEDAPVGQALKDYLRDVRIRPRSLPPTRPGPASR